MVELNNLENIKRLENNLENNRRGNVKYFITEVIMIFPMMKWLFPERTLLL